MSAPPWASATSVFPRNAAPSPGRDEAFLRPKLENMESSPTEQTNVGGGDGGAQPLRHQGSDSSSTAGAVAAAASSASSAATTADGGGGGGSRYQPPPSGSGTQVRSKSHYHSNQPPPSPGGEGPSTAEMMLRARRSVPAMLPSFAGSGGSGAASFSGAYPGPGGAEFGEQYLHSSLTQDKIVGELSAGAIAPSLGGGGAGGLNDQAKGGGTEGATGTGSASAASFTRSHSSDFDYRSSHQSAQLSLNSSLAGLLSSAELAQLKSSASAPGGSTGPSMPSTPASVQGGGTSTHIYHPHSAHGAGVPPHAAVAQQAASVASAGAPTYPGVSATSQAHAAHASFPSMLNNGNMERSFCGVGGVYPGAGMGHPHQVYGPAAVGSMDLAPLKLPPKNAGKKKPNFAEKLMSVLANPMVQPTMHWLPSGKSFCIANQKMFNDEVLPKYFREAKYESFLRRMKRWGFQRIGTAEAAGGNTATIYACELFQRDKPELCKFMCDERRWKNKPTSGGMMMMGGMGGGADMSMGGGAGGAMVTGSTIAGTGIPNQFYGGGPGGMLASLQEEGSGAEDNEQHRQQQQGLPPAAAPPGQFLSGAGAAGAPYPPSAVADSKPPATANAVRPPTGLPYLLGTSGGVQPSSHSSSSDCSSESKSGLGSSVPGSSGALQFNSLDTRGAPAAAGSFHSSSSHHHISPLRTNDGKEPRQQPATVPQAVTDTGKANSWDVTSQIDDDIKDCEEKLFLLNQLKVLKDKRRSLIEHRSGGGGQNGNSGNV